ncbi:MAG: OmpA family protein [Rhodospirillales bacterium]
MKNLREIGMEFHGARRLALRLRSTAASSALSGAFSGARRWRVAIVSVVAIPALVACSSVPDEVNPISWYEGVAGWFDDDDEQEAEYEDEDDDDDDDDDSWWWDDDDDEEDEEFAEDEDDGEFPNLASVPDRSAAVTQSGRITEGLVADPNRPDYAPSIDRQGEAQLALGDTQNLTAQAPAGQQQLSGDYQPAPDAMPKAPVTSAALTPGGGAVPPAPGLTPPPPPTFAAAPSVMPATPPYQAAAMGAVVLTPPPGVAPAPSYAMPQGAAAPSYAMPQGGGALPAVLADTSSHQAFEAFRAQMRQGAVAQFNYTPHTAGGGYGYGQQQQPTVVISSGGVGVMQPSYGGGFAAAPVSSAGAMPVSSMAAGFSGGTAAAAAASSGFGAANTPRTVLAPGSVKVATILFTNGSASLQGGDRGILNQVAALQQQKGGMVRVIGHASSRTRTMDPERHRNVNYKISANRADAVAAALVRLGVPREAIMVGAVADAEPLFYEVMPSGEAGNRRAEIYLDT